MTGETLAEAEYDERGIRYLDIEYLELPFQPGDLPGFILPHEANVQGAKDRGMFPLVTLFKYAHDGSEISVDKGSGDYLGVYINGERVEAPRRGRAESDFHDLIFNWAAMREHAGHRPLVGVKELIGLAMGIDPENID